MAFTVYKITNLITGQIYVGQTTKPISERFKQHEYASRYLGRKYSYLHRSIHKYGIHNFTLNTVLTANSQQELNSREAFCIRIFKSAAPAGFNIRTSQAGRGSLSEETKSKLSRAQTGKKRSPHRPDTIEKIRMSNAGKKRSKNTCEKSRLSHLGIRQPWKWRPIKVTLTSGLNLRYPSITDATSHLGVSRTAIGNVLSGFNKTFKGMTAVYCE